MVKVMIIDDNRSLLSDAASLRDHNNIYMILCDDQRDALAKARYDAPHAIFLSCDMALEDDKQFLVRLRAITNRDRIPIIIMCEHDQTNLLPVFSSLGFSDYILKPFNHSLFMQRLTRALKR